MARAEVSRTDDRTKPSASGSSLQYHAGETLHGLARRHEILRNLIRICVDKYEAGAFDEDAQGTDLIRIYEARIAALTFPLNHGRLDLESPGRV